MKKLIEGTLNFINRDEINKKKLAKFKTQKHNLETMNLDEFEMRYIDNKGSLSRKRFIKKSFLIVWFLSFLSFCFTVLKNIGVLFFNYLNGNVTKDVSDITMYVIETVIGILILVLIFCSVVVVEIFNDIKKIERELLIMDKIIEERMEK